MRPQLPPLDDVTAMSVFADMLSVRGDPRGELVQLQLGRERWPSDARLARAEATHLALNDRSFLGSLRTATSMCEFVWWRGYIVEARLRSRAQQVGHWRHGRWIEVTPKKPKLARLVKDLLALESAAPLKSLSISLPRSRVSGDVLLECADAVFAAPGELRSLSLHQLVGDGDGDDDWATLPTVEDQRGALHVSRDASLSWRW